MQSNVAVYGIGEVVEWEVTDAWSFFGSHLHQLSEGFRWDLNPDEWDDIWTDWDPFAESTIDEARLYAFDPTWAEDYLGYPIGQQQSVSVELMEAFWEMRAAQEEYGDEFETVMLWEEPSILDTLMGNWWLRVP